VRSRVEFRRAVIAVLRGGSLLAALTALAFRAHLNSAATACVYLIAVVVNCLDCGPWPAAAVSLLAVGCLDFFFIEPLFKFTVANPVDIAALAAFLTSSLLVSRLAARARQEADASRAQRRHVERLYELAQRLLSLDPLSFDPRVLLQALRDVFNLDSAALFDAATAEVHTAGNPPDDLAARTQDAYITGQDGGDADGRFAFRQLRLAGGSSGAIGLAGLDDAPQLAGPVAALIVAALERASTVRAASRAAAEAQSERLRTAVLDALAHQFKTPLATILTAAGGLRASGPLLAQQAELAEIVEAEAAGLSDLSSRLLRLARLDREQVQPRLEPCNLAALVQVLADRQARTAAGRRILVEDASAFRYAALDEALYSLALTQLLDNACRYSPPDSPVEVKIEARDGLAQVIVTNSGCPIPSDERGRIFERFYRGADARAAISGTGLGLYVARKIALAHGGRLELEPVAVGTFRVAFRLSVPLTSQESYHAAIRT
jgi:two-component system, OmpR family, sensor histidine kinase KdpD